jgi:hypothetical protein
MESNGGKLPDPKGIYPLVRSHNSFLPLLGEEDHTKRPLTYEGKKSTSHGEVNRVSNSMELSHPADELTHKVGVTIESFSRK